MNIEIENKNSSNKNFNENKYNENKNDLSILNLNLNLNINNNIINNISTPIKKDEYKNKHDKITERSNRSEYKLNSINLIQNNIKGKIKNL